MCGFLWNGMDDHNVYIYIYIMLLVAYPLYSIKYKLYIYICIFCGLVSSFIPLYSICLIKLPLNHHCWWLNSNQYRIVGDIFNFNPIIPFHISIILLVIYPLYTHYITIIHSYMYIYIFIIIGELLHKWLEHGGYVSYDCLYLYIYIYIPWYSYHITMVFEAHLHSSVV